MKNILLLCFALTIFSCQKQDNKMNNTSPSDKVNDVIEKAKQTPVILATGGWDGELLEFYILKEILLQNGYQAEVKVMSSELAEKSIGEGEVDAATFWLPTNSGPAYEAIKDKVINLGHIYTGAKTGIAVSSDSRMSTINDLKNFQSELDGKIYGIQAGSNIMADTEKMLDGLGIRDRFELVYSSTPAMLQQAKEIHDTGREYAITMWKPHWAFSKFGMKLLSGQESYFGSGDNIDMVVRKGLDSDNPFAYRLFKNHKLTDTQYTELMTHDSNGDNQEEMAKKWVNDNVDVVKKWIEK